MRRMNPKGKNENSELQDIREILRVIVERMVTKEEFYAALDRMMTKEEFAAFEAETRQNFREMYVRTSLVCVEKLSLNLTTFWDVSNMSSKS